MAEIRSEYYAAAAAMRDWVATEQPELDAAYILIQLSGDADGRSGGDREEESVGDTTASDGGAAVAVAAAAAEEVFRDRNIDCDRLSASSHADADGCGEIEVYPLRRKRKFRSVSELYAITKRARNMKSCRYIFQ